MRLSFDCLTVAAGLVPWPLPTRPWRSSSSVPPRCVQRPARDDSRSRVAPQEQRLRDGLPPRPQGHAWKNHSLLLQISQLLSDLVRLEDPVFVEHSGAGARARLALYGAGRPYQEQPPASPVAPPVTPVGR